MEKKQLIYWDNMNLNISFSQIVRQSSLINLFVNKDAFPKKFHLIKGNPSKELCNNQNATLALLLLQMPYSWNSFLKDLSDGISKVNDTILAIVDPVILNEDIIKHLKEVGVNGLIVPLDATTKSLFNHYRQIDDDTWKIYWKFTERAVNTFGQEWVNIRLVLGLGENEEDVIKTIEKASNLGAGINLAIIKESLQDFKLPSAGKFWRIQLAWHLIREMIVTTKQMQFNQFGSVFEFGIHPQKFENLLSVPDQVFKIGPLFGGLEYNCSWPGYLDNWEITNLFYSGIDKDFKKEIANIDWEEMWTTMSRKFQIEKVDFSELDYDLSSIAGIKGVPIAGIKSEDLRYLQKK